MSGYDGPLYETECLDLSTWFRVHDFRLHRAIKLSPGRTKFVFRDPDGRAEDLALEFPDSQLAKGLQERKNLISISKSGDPNNRRKR